MPAAPKHVIDRHGVVIAVDPHKASWTAVVVTADLAAAGAIRVDVNRAGYRQLRRFAAAWPDARWAIEGAVGLGAPLAQRLREDDIAVNDVPAKLARRVRLLSTGHGRESEEADALSVGIAAWSAQTLRAVQVDEAIAALRCAAFGHARPSGARCVRSQSIFSSPPCHPVSKPRSNIRERGYRKCSVEPAGESIV